MSDTTRLVAIQRLLHDIERFKDMSGPQQAAFRARLTKLENEVVDPDMRDVLANIRQEVGKSERKARQTVTPDDLVKEYHKSYIGKSTRQRAAFKAQISRMLNKAEEEEDHEAVSTLKALQETMIEDEVNYRKNLILRMAEERYTPEAEDEQE